MAAAGFVDELVRRAVSIYCSDRLSDKLKEFSVSGKFLWNKHASSGGWWSTVEATKAGCYVIYSKEGAILYVGTAIRKIGHRLFSHEHEKTDRWNDAAFVQIITVNEAFEAPSLEAYLIGVLNPSINKNGRTR